MQKSKTVNFKKFNARDYRVGIVVAQFNKDISEQLLADAIKTLNKYGVRDSSIKICRVAGSIEIPVILQALAMEKDYDCLVAIGTIIKGETPHFEYVAKIVSEGVLRVMLDFNIPIGFGVLTLNSHDQALNRISAGRGAAEAALHSAKLLKEMNKK